LPPENLITPEFIRRLAWEPPSTLDSSTVTGRVDRYGARPWQCELLAEDLAQALILPPPNDLPLTVDAPHRQHDPILIDLLAGDVDVAPVLVHVEQDVDLIAAGADHAGHTRLGRDHGLFLQAAC
jgi:hypothetical protein